MTAVIGAIRKALLAGIGAFATGLVGVLTADGFQIAQITYGQVSAVLLLALVAGVGTFAIPNAAQPAVTVVEQDLADAGAKAFTSTLQPALVTLQTDLAISAAPDTYGGHAAAIAPVG